MMKTVLCHSVCKWWVLAKLVTYIIFNNFSIMEGDYLSDKTLSGEDVQYWIGGKLHIHCFFSTKSLNQYCWQSGSHCSCGHVNL